MNKVISRIPHPTRYFLAALGRATFPPGEGIGADLSLFADTVAWHKELGLTAYYWLCFAEIFASFGIIRNSTFQTGNAVL